MAERDSHEAMIEKLKTLARGRLVEPPDAAVRKARALGASLPQPARGFLAGLVEVLFDSGLALATAGVRSGEAGERRLLYAVSRDASRVEIDLRLRRTAGATVEVMGQVHPAPQGAEVRIAQGARTLRAKVGDEGEFVLRKIRPSGTTLALEVLEDGVVAVALDAVPLPEEP